MTKPSSDVARPRRVALLAAAGAVFSAASVAAFGTPSGTPRAVARPHAVAHVGCATCHAPDHDANYARAAACETCHGAAAHPARAAHAAALRAGAMTCATCHPAHAGAQGVTFAPEGARRWGAGERVALDVDAPRLAMPVSVPLVPLASCAGCHEPARASDPIARCVPARTRLALASGAPEDASRLLATTAIACFDEHAGAPAPARSVKCASEHVPDRQVAIDAARVVAATTPWVDGGPPATASPWAPAATGLAAALGLGLVLAGRDARRARGEAPAPRPLANDAPAPPLAPPAKKRLPVIDASTCIGCQACVDACPFDVLAIERYVAVVARPEECCGVVLCAQVCPNGSLQILEADAAARERPAFDEHLESTDVPGVFLAGDLTGLPLVKNAIRQGALVVDRIAATVPRRARSGAEVDADVLVVGAGPAGLSAALRAREKGLSCVVIEQATLAASIKSFPRDKIVHDPPLHLPVVGELWLREATKEELVAQWTRIVRTRELDVREGLRLVGLEQRAVFEARLEGEGGATTTLRARRVVLAIGRRGTPRSLPLALSGSAEENVHHALVDARSFAGRHVVVVGLGDSALEAIVALARQPGTHVTVSYRRDGFARGKTRNVEEVKRLAEAGRIDLRLGTVPVAFDGREVVLGPSSARVRADAVFLLLGGEPAWGLLARLGLRRPPAGAAPAFVPNPKEPS